MTFEITDSNIDTFLHEDKPQVIDFGTEWCGLCRTLAPIVEGLAAEYKGRINVGTCDAEENNAWPPVTRYVMFPRCCSFATGRSWNVTLV